MRYLRLIPTHPMNNNSNVIFNCNVKDNVDFIRIVTHPRCMYVITFANPKGGSGKTTSAMLLAEQIALSGGRVAILDLDPNANILGWHGGAKKQAEACHSLFMHAHR